MFKILTALVCILAYITMINGDADDSIVVKKDSRELKAVKCGQGKRCLFLPYKLTYPLAVRSCQNQFKGGELVALDDDIMNLDVKQFATNRKTNGAWTGGWIDAKGGVTWSDHTKPNSVRPSKSYSDWFDEIQPTESGAIALMATAEGGYVWQVQDPSTKLDVVCSY